MIEIIDKHKAKLIVNIGSGKTRKRKSKIVSYSGKRDLKNKYDAFEAECRRTPVSQITLKQLLDSYIEKKKMLGAKATTIKGYEAVVKRTHAYFGEVYADKLTTYQMEDFVISMSDSSAPKTIKNTVSLISSAYKQAIWTGQLRHNPCENVTMPKQKRKEIIVFSEKEILAFMQALSEDRLDYKVGYELCLFCGLRRSEVLGLREDDISIPFGSVTIRSTRHRIDGDTDIVQDTKTESSHRTLAVPDFLIREIDILIHEHREFEYNNTDYLIQNGFGEPMSPSTFTKYIRKVEDRAGLPPVSVHGLRHTFASMLNSDGIDIARISSELGHTTISTTTDIYTHVFNGATASSRGIADSINKKFENYATFLPPEANEKA